MPDTLQAPRPPRQSTVTPILPPLLVDAGQALAWSDTTDVLVVGWGAAGACAAIEARAAGAEVLVLDRFGGGGASVLSGGVVYAGGGTPYQQQAGFADTPQAMQDYLRQEVNGMVSEATLQRFCQDSAANLAWLEQQGVRFGASMPAHKTSYPPKGKFLYYSGNEVVPAYGSSQPAAPRGHRALSPGQSGAALYAALQDSTRKAGARTLTQASVRRLVQERLADGSPGRVLGVEVWQLPEGAPATRRHAELDGLVAQWRLYQQGRAEAARREAAGIEQAQAQPRLIRARRGVILATGGHIYNPELVAQHAPAYRRGWKVGGAGCDGSGLRLGQSVGAAAAALGAVSGWRFITPPYSWPKGLVVNRRGARFCNEQVYGAKLGHEMIQHQEGRAWLLLDAGLRRRAVWECLFGGLWSFQALPALALMFRYRTKAATLEALAAKIGADAATLRATVDEANAAARGEREDPLGKSADMRRVLEKGPFYAINISIGEKMFPLATLSLGGLRVHEDSGQVLDAQGQPLPGLYAAGRTAVGIPSGGYISGLSLADCVFSGRRAGRCAASA
ncbi:FAD-binding protein [Rhodoferax lacus]|uniref:FAD-binding protein n=1 Tax=Rhodoferax lacus TaxID=2184758 RepID=A0A3E1R9X1_9BURK|nr:FAD-binding protein [Rhodoferax lacus]RFO96021.1 FAD-binding protein [Rhodoferax lacus]